jgi:putative pyoverdin transport system ATP-binding/permease protein
VLNLKNLMRLLTRLGPRPVHRLVLGASASALSSTIVLAIVNLAAEDIAARKSDLVNLWMAAAFIIGILIYATAETWMVSRMGADIEEATDGLRMRLLEQLRHADLLKLERFGETPLFESITQSCQIISMNSQFVALSLRSVLLIVALMIYILAISQLAFVVIIVTLAAGTMAYRHLGLTIERQRRILTIQESALFESVSDLFDGFKEQRLNSARSRDLNDSFISVSSAMTGARNEMHQQFWQQFVFGETFYNLMIGLVVFVVPSYSVSFDQDVVKVAAACLFMAASVFGLLQSMAVTAAAEAAAGRMLRLETELVDLAEPGSYGPNLPIAADFSEIRMMGVEFTFPAPADEQAFSVGPLDLVIRRGETTFITGGNGSGKSTFLKLLCGLYHPLKGRIMVDGVEIEPTRLASYRALMATVFADFHLFAQLYGLDLPLENKAHDLLHWMELGRMTTLEGDRFSRRDLSAGQRKRLALVAAVLEQKPILILDEWAADQDPQFRFKFYREILPELKRRGLTIIAVTHDDHYFDVAERRLHMEEGLLTELLAGREV